MASLPGWLGKAKTAIPVVQKSGCDFHVERGARFWPNAELIWRLPDLHNLPVCAKTEKPASAPPSLCSGGGCLAANPPE
jgi:hypothetical protein